MIKLLRGREVAGKIEKEEILPNLQKLKSEKPHLAIIYIGENKQSQIYIHEKQKAGRRLRIEVFVYRLPADCDQFEIEKTISFLNKDPNVSGIIIQLPLPQKLSNHRDELLALIDPDKDVDCLGPSPLDKFFPPTAAAVFEIIDYYQINLKNITLIGKGILVGKPVSQILDKRQISYQLIDTHTTKSDQNKILKNADVIIAGSSSPKPTFGANDIKEDAVVIDCAQDFDQNDGRVLSQPVRTDNISITPKIGGIGPVTVACLMRNVVLAKLWQK